MQKSYWKAGGANARRVEINWPSAGQIARQFGLAALVMIVWGAAFFGFLQLTDPARSEVAEAAPPEAVVVQPTATETATPPPTATPEPTATNTSTSTSTPTTPAVDDQPTEVPESEPALPTPTPTETPLPEPTATNTPLLEPTPTDTPQPPADSPETDGVTVSFSQDVLPIFENRCVKCHGGEETEEGLDLTSHVTALAGGWNGTVIEPGDVEGSYLIEQIVSGEMPDKEPRLLPSQIRAITAWVEAGAPDN